MLDGAVFSECCMKQCGLKLLMIKREGSFGLEFSRRWCMLLMSETDASLKVPTVIFGTSIMAAPASTVLDDGS